ncbi:hypothetical protein L6R52_15800 [Myxococcota bacterium]|nr:hypothetical protein [Myxococcota bacterium]
MHSKEVNASSPLRILEKSIHGGLGAGNLGVVLARAGVGKTAFLVQIGLDDLMRGKDTLHVALGQSLERVHAWYDTVFDDIAKAANLEDRDDVTAMIAKHRVIQAYPDHNLTAERLEKAVELYTKHMSFKPTAILIDGFDWENGGHTATAAALGAFKSFAKRLGAELWMSAQSHRTSGEHPTKMVPPVEEYAELVDVAVFLDPVADHVTVRILKDHSQPFAPDTHLMLHPDTMRMLDEGEGHHHDELGLPAAAYTLLSGGAMGAEAEFGVCAEKWGLHETTFSFKGRPVERTRGLVELSDEELRHGEVSKVYFTAQMHRAFPQTPMFQNMLKTIWHQVNTAAQVFVVGTILPDGTVKGGTGWAAELARHWHKPVFVFDQEKHHWLAWREDKWTKVDPPKITKTRFAGTGTRFLSEEGKAAIHALFERSFSNPTAAK